MSMFYGTVAILVLAQTFAATSNFAGIVKNDYYHGIQTGEQAFVQEGSVVKLVEGGTKLPTGEIVGGTTVYAVDTAQNAQAYSTFATFSVIIPVFTLTSAAN